MPYIASEAPLIRPLPPGCLPRGQSNEMSALTSHQGQQCLMKRSWPSPKTISASVEGQLRPDGSAVASLALVLGVTAVGTKSYSAVRDIACVGDAWSGTNPPLLLGLSSSHTPASLLASSQPSETGHVSDIKSQALRSTCGVLDDGVPLMEPAGLSPAPDRLAAKHPCSGRWPRPLFFGKLLTNNTPTPRLAGFRPLSIRR